MNMQSVSYDKNSANYNEDFVTTQEPCFCDLGVQSQENDLTVCLKPTSETKRSSMYFSIDAGKTPCISRYKAPVLDVMSEHLLAGSLNVYSKTFSRDLVKTFNEVVILKTVISHIVK